LLLIRGVKTDRDDNVSLTRLRAICARCKKEVAKSWTGERPRGLSPDILYESMEMRESEDSPEQWYASMALHHGEESQNNPETLQPY